MVSEKSPLLADALNARTFSIAEKQSLDIVTICSTCQGTLKKTEAHLNEDDEKRKKAADLSLTRSVVDFFLINKFCTFL